MNLAKIPAPAWYVLGALAVLGFTWWKGRAAVGAVADATNAVGESIGGALADARDAIINPGLAPSIFNKPTIVDPVLGQCPPGYVLRQGLKGPYCLNDWTDPSRPFTH